MRTLTKTLALIAVLSLALAPVWAGCGVKDTHQGTLEAIHQEDNSIVVLAGDGEKVKLTLTADTKVMNADGKKVEVSNLVGKKVKVVSEHAKIDSIEQMA